MNRCPKGVSTAKHLACRKALPIPGKKLEKPFWGWHPPSTVAIGGLYQVLMQKSQGVKQKAFDCHILAPSKQ